MREDHIRVISMNGRGDEVYGSDDGGWRVAVPELVEWWCEEICNSFDDVSSSENGVWSWNSHTWIRYCLQATLQILVVQETIVAGDLAEFLTERSCDK